MIRVPISILVNDSSPQFGEFFADSAARHGWECVQASNHFFFSEALHDQIFDLICLQLVHPEIDGLGALQEIADTGFSGTVLMFNQSQELYARAATNLANAFRFSLVNYRWPQQAADIDLILKRHSPCASSAQVAVPGP